MAAAAMELLHSAVGWIENESDEEDGMMMLTTKGRGERKSGLTAEDNRVVELLLHQHQQQQLRRWIVFVE